MKELKSEKVTKSKLVPKFTPTVVEDRREYQILLRLQPIDKDTDFVIPKPYRYEFLAENEDRVDEIVRYSLYGFDVLRHKMKDDKYLATIVSNENAKVYLGILSSPTFEEAVKDAYDSGPDTWMGGDIDIGDDRTELHLDLLRVRPSDKLVL